MLFTRTAARIQHVALLRCARPLAPAAAADAQAVLLSVPGVEHASVSVGPPASSTSRYDVALTVRLLDEAALAEFHAHPDVVGVRASLLGIDGEDGDAAAAALPEGAVLAVDYAFSHNAQLRPLPAMLLGALAGGATGAGLGLLL